MIGPAVQAELGATPPAARIETIHELRTDQETAARLRPADIKELALYEAIAAMELGAPKMASVAWRQCLDFVAEHCPPGDEGAVCYGVHAALCAAAAGQAEAAADLLSGALACHDVAFGPGLDLFIAR